jgi:hypothetical protein
VRRSGLQLQPLHPALGEALRDHPQQDSNNTGWWSNTLLHSVLRTTLKYLFCEIKLKPSVAIFSHQTEICSGTLVFIMERIFSQRIGKAWKSRGVGH